MPLTNDSSQKFVCVCVPDQDPSRSLAEIRTAKTNDLTPNISLTCFAPRMKTIWLNMPRWRDKSKNDYNLYKLQ